MRRDILYWVRFTAVTTVSAAMTATLLNIGAAFAADISPDLLNLDPGLVKEPAYQSLTTADIVGKPDIHNQVLDELTGGGPVDSHAKIENRGSLREDKEGPAIPTSMLWPAYKYIPQLSKALRG